MSQNLTHILVWGSRLLCVAVALWWPHLWYDPIYTPRQARLSGQELHLPNGMIPHTQDERAMAIFWEWKQRTLVTTEWGTSPYIGLRNPQGRFQTLLVTCFIFVISSSILYFFSRKDPAALEQMPRRTGVLGLLTTPVWRIIFSRSHSTTLFKP